MFKNKRIINSETHQKTNSLAQFSSNEANVYSKEHDFHNHNERVKLSNDYLKRDIKTANYTNNSNNFMRNIRGNT
jgi:hypothetical protein